MKVYLNPPKTNWGNLMKRPQLDTAQLTPFTATLFQKVKILGDEALRLYTAEYDSVDIDELRVSKGTIKDAAQGVKEPLKKAIEQAYSNILTFHKAQLALPQKIETTKGVMCWQENRPVERVGIYIPGGSAPLFSTVLMLGIPAKIAGCKTIVLCTPPNKNGEINPVILYAAKRVGITEIFKVGGAQSIAGMTYGTATIPKVDKIFGPATSM